MAFAIHFDPNAELYENVKNASTATLFMMLASVRRMSVVERKKYEADEMSEDALEAVTGWRMQEADIINEEITRRGGNVVKLSISSLKG